MEHGDIPAVLLLFDAVAAERLWIGTEPGYDREKYQDMFGFSLGNGNGMFVAHTGGQIVGVITEYRHDPYGHTIGMLVDERYRGMGIGRALLDRLVTWARERGIPHIALLVFPHNERALALYRSFGFVEIDAQAARISRASGEAWDAILMRKVL
ncbi:MAG TPA: GNAT family N-acetyltransferase [Candidatus Baltobacteraceae bacterium]|nr:GNAT family N-acetyltransferase [Candidatus Baltobacteraceae bacterium]